MNFRLDGKTAVIIAAGIGRATASAYHLAGADVWATDIDADALASLKAEHAGMNTTILDVTDKHAIAAFAQLNLFFFVSQCSLCSLWLS